MPSNVSTSSYSLTFSANTPVVAVGIRKLFKVVASHAMSFSTVDSSRTIAAQNIFSVRHCFKVLWIYASSISAKVVYLQPFRYRPESKYIRHTMGKLSRDYSANPKLTVTPNKQCAFPQPARVGFFDEFPESIFKLFPHSLQRLLDYAPSCQGVV